MISCNHGLKQTWEIGKFSMKTRRYVGKREEKITTEYEKLVSLCFVDEFPKTKRRKYPQYTCTSEKADVCNYAQFQPAIHSSERL